eukprot:4605058-Prymnesium_polylepis.1
MGPLVLGIVGLIGMIVLSLVAAVYPAKDLEDRYDQKNCVRPIFSMGFRDQNSDLQCKEMEDEYRSKYIEPCWKIRRGENVGVWARYSRDDCRSSYGRNSRKGCYKTPSTWSPSL